MIESINVAKAFEALGHETRLAVFRLLIPAGPEGLTPSVIATRVGLAASALSFHLARLANAGLIRGRRQGRHLHYAVQYERLAELVDFLAGDCCAAAPTGCLPECPPPGSVSSRCCPSTTGDLKPRRS